ASTGQGLFTGLPNTGSSTETTGPPRFLEDPVTALLSDPGGTSALGHYCASVLPSAFTTASASATVSFRGSITRPARSLSTLRRVDCSTATQDSLPDGRPAFPDGIWLPAGSQRKVSGNHPPFPGLAWRTVNEIGRRGASESSPRLGFRP